MGRKILLLFLIVVGIAIIIYTVDNWHYINHTIAIMVIIANVIAVIWDLAALR
jgi:hypothetical protein